MLTIYDKIERLLTIPTLSEDERAKLLYAMLSLPEEGMEDHLHPTVRAHIHARYEWFYCPDGQRREGT